MFKIKNDTQLYFLIAIPVSIFSFILWYTMKFEPMYCGIIALVITMVLFELFKRWLNV